MFTIGMMARMPGYPALLNTFQSATATRMYQISPKMPVPPQRLVRSAVSVTALARVMRLSIGLPVGVDAYQSRALRATPQAHPDRPPSVEGSRARYSSGVAPLSGTATRGGADRGAGTSLISCEARRFSRSQPCARMPRPRLVPGERELVLRAGE